MPVQIVIEGTKNLGEGIWLGSLAPHEAQMLGRGKSSEGPVTVLLVPNPVENSKQNLIFDARDVVVANQGTTSKTVVISTRQHEREEIEIKPNNDMAPTSAHLGRGDWDFLNELKILPDEPRKAGEKILKRIRTKYPGDMQRGKRRNFKNTPDNFWYVIIQPYKKNLSITVRGLPERFRPSNLELKEDRPGYTRFYVSRETEVEDALRVIEASRRKL